MRKTTLRAGLLGALIAAAGLAMPGAASARTFTQAQEACPNGSLCLWQSPNFEGRMASFRRGVNNLAEFNGGFLNDQTSSFLNETSEVWCLGEDASPAFFRRPRHFQVEPAGTFLQDVSFSLLAGPHPFNNVISSAIRSPRIDCPNAVNR